MNSSLKITPKLSVPLLATTLILIVYLFIASSIIDIHAGYASVDGHYQFSFKWGTLGSGNGQFNKPSGIAVSPLGLVYVSDYGNNRIQMFQLINVCPTGSTQIVPGVCFVKSWGTFGSGNGQFNGPGDITLDSSSHVYVADSGNHRIQVFNGSGAFISTWNSDGPGTVQFGVPTGVAVDTFTRNVYVTEGSNPGVLHKYRMLRPCIVGTIEVFSGLCFKSKLYFGSNPVGPHEQRTEWLDAVAVNSSSHELYISDYITGRFPEINNSTIIRMTGDGTKLGSWGGEVGGDDGKFYSATGIAIGPSGSIYVGDFVFDRIQVFTKDGTFITKLEASGSADGQFNKPYDVALDSTGHVYVADSGNNRIQVFLWKTDVGGTGGAGGGTSPNIGVK